MGQRLTYWIFLGTIGFAAFFVLRSSISFNAGAPVENSRATVEGRTAELATQLGFSADSLHMMTRRKQYISYYKALKDSLGDQLPSPANLNRGGVNLTGWNVQIGRIQQEGEGVSNEFENYMQELSLLNIAYGQNGKVRNLVSNPQNINPTFVPGDSLFSIASHIVKNIFSYDLNNYSLNYVDISDTLITSEPGYDQQPLNLSDSQVGNNMVFKWVKRSAGVAGPTEISLEVKPIIRENNQPNLSSIQYGVSIENFKVSDQYEPKQLSGSQGIENVSLATMFGSLAILAILIFFYGIKFINNGKVEWRRAIFMLVSILLGVLGWRIIYMMNMTSGYWNQTSEWVFILNNSVLAAALGLYSAMAYIAWEAMARSRNEDQLRLIDAFWRKRFFFRETGEGILRGYALGGVLLGLFAVLLYLMDTVYYQSDGQFGFAEASMQPKLLTINMAVWVNTWLVALGHVGVMTGILREKISNKWLYYIGGALILGVLLAGSAPMFEIVGPTWYDIIIFSIIAIIIIYAVEVSGLITFSVAWWTITAIILVMPYWGATSMDVAYVAWSQILILALPLILGFIAYRYGDSIAEIGGYVPEYEERMFNHLRVEKEIEIARESQFRLMPLRPPELEGVDVYGFFMPSFEVGGDYFDYITSTNGSEDSKILNMTIADVSGKAMKAAMHAVFTSGLLLSRLHRDTPESILREITPTLHSRTDPQTFITCIIAQYHPKDMKLRLANAGHCLPILKRDGKAEFISTPDPKFPLGVLNSVDYKLHDIQLQKGDFILLYSDGLPEAVNPEGQRLGFDSMLSMVETMDTESRPSNEISMDIKRRVQKFSDYQLADDTTIICLKV